VVSLPTGARQDGPSLDIDRDESFLLGDTAPGLPTAVAFNEDGTRMALALTVGYKSVVRFFEWPALTAVGPQLGMFGAIAQLSFNAGGGALAAAPATPGTSVHVWDIDSATETLRVPVPGTGIPAVAFTQQGRLAIVSSGALLEVPEDLRTLPAVACGWLARNLDEGEWAYHLKDEVPYEKTCGNLP